ncbi:MAG: hypothetical protein OHK0017_08490 [Patescibacteria group bacterium]
MFFTTLSGLENILVRKFIPANNVLIGLILGCALTACILSGKIELKLLLVINLLGLSALFIFVIIFFQATLIEKNLTYLRYILNMLLVACQITLLTCIVVLVQAEFYESKNNNISNNEVIYLTDYEQKDWGKQWYGWIEGQIWEVNIKSSAMDNFAKWKLSPGLGFTFTGEKITYKYQETSEFNYQNYALAQGIQGRINVTEINSTANCNWFCRWIQIWFNFKRDQTSRIHKLLCQENLNEIKAVIPYYNCQNVKSLSIGLIFGGSQTFSDQLKKDFQITGLSHIVAISGYNVTLLILLIDYILVRIQIPFRSKIFCFIFVLFCLVWLVGPSASILRAVIMGMVILTAQAFGRPCSPMRALFWSIVILGLINPLSFFSISLQLSASATFGLILFSGVLPRHKNKVIGGILEIAGATITANLFTLPIMANIFGYFSPLSFIPNLIVLPFVPILMWLNCFSLFPVIGGFISWITAIFQSLILALVSCLAIYLPVLHINQFSWQEILGWYGFLILVSSVLKLRAQKMNHLQGMFQFMTIDNASKW